MQTSGRLSKIKSYVFQLLLDYLLHAVKAFSTDKTSHPQSY